MPDASTAALVAALAPGADGSRATLRDWPAPNRWKRRDTATLIHEEGIWERMRDLWAFALPRGLRKASPAEILAAAGLAVDGTTRPSLPPVAP